MDLKILLKANLNLVLLSLLAMIASLIIASLRLIVLKENLGFKNSLAIWFSSQFLSNISPTHSGGEIIRFFAISMITRSSKISTNIVLFEILLDVFIPNILAIVSAIFFIVFRESMFSAVPIIFSSFNILVWLTVFLKRRKVHSIVEGFLKRTGIIKYMQPSLADLDFKVDNFKLAASVALTLFRILLVSFSIYLAYLAVGIPLKPFEALVAYLYALSLGIIPLPAGALGMEIGMSIVKPGAGVVLWRIIAYYILTLICFLYTLVLLKKLGMLGSSK